MPPRKPSLSSDPSNAEQLRSAHVRTLEQMGVLTRENAMLQAEVEKLEKAARGAPRMKPEELDSLYVEERRLIESLERQNAELKAAAAGARSTRDADVKKAQAERDRLQAQCDELRENQRRAAQLAAGQLAKIREAYQEELEKSAADAESVRVKLADATMELRCEQSRANKLENDLAKAKSEIEALKAMSAPTDDKGLASMQLQLRSALLRADSAEATALESGQRASSAELAAEAARSQAEAAQAALGKQAEELAKVQQAAADEKKQHKEALAAAAAKAKAELDSLRSQSARVEAELRSEIARLSALLDEARQALANAPPAVVADEGRSVFTDFVGLKREINGLKEENERMRRGIGPSAPTTTPAAANALGNAGVIPLRPQQRPPQPQPQRSQPLLKPDSNTTSKGDKLPTQHQQPPLAGSLAVSRRSAFHRQ